MARPRSELICLDETPYYHCVSRCVRRAYLCGHDPLSGQSYEHRRQWVEDRLIALVQAFSVLMCAYSVMSNHTHVVLKADKAATQTWSHFEILSRWHRVFRGTHLTQRYCCPKQAASLSPAELESVRQTAEVYRARLYDISWFMRALNEQIARRANEEDECTGRFWEGRFKSQALMDEASLAACMAYVDLNPIRAGIADTPEASAHTSICRRIRAARHGRQPASLLPFSGLAEEQTHALPFHFEDYLTLLDMTGRIPHTDKPGVIRPDIAPVLARTGLDTVCWPTLASSIETHFSTSVSLTLAHRRFELRRGISSA